MRKIKFRGLTKDGKWVYGYYVHVSNKHYIILDNAEFFRIYFGGEPANEKAIYGYIEVVPKTVGQFTGLHDKNGKEAYHKDKYIRSDGQEGVIRNFIEDTYHLLVWIRGGGTFEIIGHENLSF